MADTYTASREWLVYLTDFFLGDPARLKFVDVVIPVYASKQNTLSKYTSMLIEAPTLVM
jgi:hypothetical protein